MIRLPDLELTPRSKGYLERWQKAIDDLPGYAARVAEGKRKFESRNDRDNLTFREVRATLTRMCQGARRCGYCEDSVADEVEHIMPKDLYPEAVFRWDNYLYACGPCNGPKNNRFAILAGTPAALMDVTRPDGAPIAPPMHGAPALINPRNEDPLDFLFLDLQNTFIFNPMDDLDAEGALRAEYTIDVLRLNTRDYLVQARRTAFGTYRARLIEYIDAKQSGASQSQLDRHRDELLLVGHQTVWREMQRQHSLHPSLASLFARSPETLSWQ